MAGFLIPSYPDWISTQNHAVFQEEKHQTSIKIINIDVTPSLLSPLGDLLVEVRDSRTGYLLPARDGPGALPDGQSCWDVAAAAVAVTWKNRELQIW